MNAAAKQPTNARDDNREVTAEDLRNINAAGSVLAGPGPKYPGDGDYILWGPGTPNYDPRTDGEVN